MKAIKAAVAVAAALLLVTQSAGVIAVSPGDSLATQFDSSTTNADTVVVVVGAQNDTREARAELLAASAIANEHNYSIVSVPSGELPYSVVQTLSQRVEHGSLRHAIVVGADENETEPVATALTAVGYEQDDGDRITLDVSDQITGESVSDVLRRASIQQWDDGTNAAVLTTLTKSDSRKAALAVTNDSIAGAPILAQSSDYADINATLGYLGVSTVYVTPGVSDSTQSDLQDDGYTVDETPAGVDLTQDLPAVAADFAPDTAEDVGVIGVSNHVYAASQLGAGNNSTVLVAAGSDQLGSATDNELSNMSEADNVYVLGSSSDVSESVFSSISSAARSNASVDRVERKYGPTDLYLRTSLLTSGYQYGVLTSHVTSSGDDQLTVEITNIGYSTVPEEGNVSVTAMWPGVTDPSSDPSGQMEDGAWVVTHDESLDPDDTFTIDLQASSVENGGHPQMDYYVQTSSGGLIGATGGLGFFTQALDLLPSWLQDLVNSVLPDSPIIPTNPIVQVVVLVALAVVVWLVIRGGFSEYKARRR